MKLLNIKISAFGPFKNEEYINFEDFSDSRIFLISGKTGSGKTTIFDAISYALFGHLTGEYKSEGSVRSQYATKEIKTYVSLEFKANNRVYRITRKPSYYVEGRKTPLNAESILEDLNNNIVLSTKQADVNSRICKIIGFKYEQFKQIVVLPQGEFIKILNSKAKDKEELLAAILDTSIYNKITKKIKEDCDLIISKINVVTSQLDSILKEYKVNNILELKELANNLDNEEKAVKLNLDNMDEILNKLKESLTSIKSNNSYLLLIANAKEKLQLLINENLDIENKRSLLNKLIIYKEALGIYNHLLELESKNSIMLNKLQQLDSNKLSIYDNYNSIENLRNEIKILKSLIDNLYIQNNELNSIKDKFELINSNNMKIKLLEDKINSLSNDLSNLDYNSNNLKENYEKLNVKYNEMLEYINSYSFEEYTLQEGRYKDYKYKFDLDLKLKEKENAIELLTTNINSTKEVIRELSNNYEIKFKLFKNNILVSYAFINENEPCPLCGSIHHPNVISKPDILITEDDLKEILKKLDAQNNALSKFEERLENINYEIYQIKSDQIFNISLDEYKECEDEYFKQKHLQDIYYEYRNEVPKINKQLQKLKNEYDSALTKINDINLLINKHAAEKGLLINNNKEALELIGDNNLLEINNNIDNNNYQINELNNQIDSINSLINSYNSKYEAFNIEYQNTLDNINVYNNDINIYNSKLNEILTDDSVKIDFINNIDNINNIDSLSSYIKEYDSLYIKYTSNIDTYSNLLNSNEYIDTSDLEDNINDMSNNRIELNNKYLELYSMSSQINNNICKYLLLEKSIKDDYDKYKMVNELYELCSGSLKGNKKISLQKYVLMRLLDDILCYANIYLSHFSLNRYTLVRDKGDALSNSGLELLVDDSYTGYPRNVSSLSGGESFMTALALALGMSDCIMNLNGGINMENIFIDEGFGSLDDEALNNAIETLIDLANNGRLIGIISHIEEIKNLIPNSIDVIKTNQGSKIKINN